MDLGDMSVAFEIVDMTDNQDRMTMEAHVRALVLLEDALKKKDRMLLDREMENEKRELDPDCPFLDQQLVLKLISKLREVHLLKDESLEKETAMAGVFGGPNSFSVALYQPFWEGREYLGLRSRPGALILATAHILSYIDNAWGKYDVGALCASDICAAFEIWMNHDGIYENGAYTCCGEETRDSVCEESRMSRALLPYMPESDVISLKQATLDVLLDSQKKDLLVELPEKPHALLTSPKFPIITNSLVQDLIGKLKEVKFKLDGRLESSKIAYTNPSTKNIIYVCPLFWREKDYLCQGSRVGTIILHLARLLGYPHCLDGATAGNTSYTTVHDNDNGGSALSSPSNIGGSFFNQPETSGNNKMTADTICAAFELWMKHREKYENESYTCCMETAQHSVCAKSVMKLCLQELKLRNENDLQSINTKRPKMCLQ